MNRVAACLVVVIFGSIPVWAGDSYFLHILIITGIFIIASMSLNLLLGYSGQLSLGHVGFFGLGAYVSALVSLGFELQITDEISFSVPAQPVWCGLLAAIVAAGLFGWFIGKISFKIRGAYFVIVSISFAEVLRLVALNWVSLTQGPMALTNIPPFGIRIPGVWEQQFYGEVSNYYLVLAAAIFSFIVIKRVVRSRAGRAMVALKENEALATSVGIDVTRYLVLASIISGAMAGMAGSLYAHYIRIIDPDIFDFIYTVTMVIMVIVGGKGTLAGPVVGGLIFGFVPDLLRGNAPPQVQWIIYGALMIAILYVLPNGIVPALQNLMQRLRGALPVLAPLRSRKNAI
jgi:branched-chain amino acid transport system permease protein